MNTNQLPIHAVTTAAATTWQHGEGIVTFKKHGILATGCAA